MDADSALWAAMVADVTLVARRVTAICCQALAALDALREPAYMKEVRRVQEMMAATDWTMRVGPN